MLFCHLGVRLNKPYSVRVPMDIPVFTGTHADFLVIVSVLLFYDVSFDPRKLCLMFVVTVVYMCTLSVKPYF